MKYIDLTHKYKNGMTFGNPENHPVVTIEPMATLERKGCNTSRIILGSHLGTHMDGKKHLLEDGEATDCIDLSGLIGPVSVVDLSGIKAGCRAEVEDLKDVEISERMIFSFGWSQYFGTEKYSESWPYFSREAIKCLIDHGMRFIGMDIVGPDDKKDRSFPCHKALFEADVVIVENLANTSSIDFEQEYEMIAMPLSLEGSDGAPVRIILVNK